MARSDTRAGPHEFIWTRESVSRFWNWYSARSVAEPFFSQLYRRRILEFAASAAPLSGARVLDFGSGPGFLLDALLDAGACCEGVELSEEIALQATQRLAGRPGFGGVHVGTVDDLNLADSQYDFVFAVEVVEHLLDEQVDPFFAEMHRLLRSGGVLVVTTPHSEDLDRRKSLCPECGATFHPMQHVQSWTPASLAARARTHGFVSSLAKSVYLGAATSRDRLALRLKHLLRLGQRSQPNLFFAARAG
jgi:2-polyprenyl-3-methyl-5-hydroxy-6-metoxy-1,4-benzoquinol methylase